MLVACVLAAILRARVKSFYLSAYLHAAVQCMCVIVPRACYRWRQGVPYSTANSNYRTDCR